MRSAKYLPQLKRFNSIAKQATPGERVISSLFPNRTTSYGWDQNVAEQVAHFRNWTYVAVNTICCRIGGLFPNLAIVVDREVPGLTVKGAHRGLLNTMGRGFGGTSSMEFGGHSFMTMGEYRSKALSVIKPHDDLEPVGNDHPLRRLLENPNPVDTTFDLLYESQMFQELCGVSYIWAVPNSLNGTPCELWVIPSHWVWPRTGGGLHVSPEHPHAGELIEYYEVRPWGGAGASGLLKFPPNEIIMERWKSPQNKIGGWSKLTAGSQWIDTEESISRSRWAQFINQARPEFWLELAQGYEDPDDNMIARIESKFMSRMQGEGNYGKPVITPPGAKITPLSFSPTEMAYFSSEEQIRDMILSLFQVPKAAVGISEGMTFGSVIATLASMCSQCINPRLQMRGQTLTKHLASRWSQPGRRVKLFWDDITPADPAQVNSDLTTDMQCHAVTPNEVRALRGRKGYEHGGDDPLVSGPGGIVPLPLNTGEDQQDLADLLKPFTQPEQVEQQAMEGGPLELPEGGGEEQPLALESKPLDMQAGVEEPNGEPSKRIGKVVRKSTADSAVGDLSNYLNGLPEKHKEGLYVWVNEGPPKLAIVDFMDWFDGDTETQSAIKSQASKWTGDEQRVIIQNEGGKPGPEWQQVFPDKYDKTLEFSTEKELNAFLKKNNLVRKKAYTAKHARRKEAIPGGLADNASPSSFDSDKLAQGIKVEMEHTSSRAIAQEIAMDHLTEDPNYYDKLARAEAKSVKKPLPRAVYGYVINNDFRCRDCAEGNGIESDDKPVTQQPGLNFRCNGCGQYYLGDQQWGSHKKSYTKAEGGSCKPGERADLTGCTPISGEGGAKTTETPSSAGNSSKVKTAIVDNFKAAAEKFSDVKETMLAIGEIGGSALPESVQTALVKTYGAVRYVEHKLMTGYNKSREMAETVAIERGLGEEHAKMVGKAVGIADLAVGWTIQAPAILMLTGGNVAAAKVGTWIPACSLGYIAYSTVRNPMATIRAAKKMISGKKEEPKKAKKTARKPAKKRVKK